MNRILTFLNLLDNGGNLSLTNIAVIICLVKLAMSAQLSSTDVAALLAAIANYCHKRYTNDGAANG